MQGISKILFPVFLEQIIDVVLALKRGVVVPKLVVEVLRFLLLLLLLLRLLFVINVFRLVELF